MSEAMVSGSGNESAASLAFYASIVVASFISGVALTLSVLRHWRGAERLRAFLAASSEPSSSAAPSSESAKQAEHTVVIKGSVVEEETRRASISSESSAIQGALSPNSRLRQLRIEGQKSPSSRLRFDSTANPLPPLTPLSGMRKRLSSTEGAGVGELTELTLAERPKVPTIEELIRLRSSLQHRSEVSPVLRRLAVAMRTSESKLSSLEVVGGHASKKDKVAENGEMLQLDGLVLKPFQSASAGAERLRGELEAEFYNRITTMKHPLAEIVPQYHGVHVTESGERYLVLEDLTRGFNKPCVLDLKMGRRTYGESASAEKAEKERKKYPPQERIGFRFSGMRVYQAATGEYVESTREWCLGLRPEDVVDAFERFFFDGSNVRYSLIRATALHIQKIIQTLEEFPTWRMYGASILIVYDGAPDTSKYLASNPAESPVAGSTGVVRVKMIDFAHCYEIKDPGGKDHGVLTGLSFVSCALHQILDESRKNRGRRMSVVEQTANLLRIFQGDKRLSNLNASQLSSIPSPTMILEEGEEEEEETEADVSLPLFVPPSPAEADGDAAESNVASSNAARVPPRVSSRQISMPDAVEFSGLSFGSSASSSNSLTNNAASARPRHQTSGGSLGSRVSNLRVSTAAAHHARTASTDSSPPLTPFSDHIPSSIEADPHLGPMARAMIKSRRRTRSMADMTPLLVQAALTKSGRPSLFSKSASSRGLDSPHQSASSHHHRRTLTSSSLDQPGSHLDSLHDFANGAIRGGVAATTLRAREAEAPGDTSSLSSYDSVDVEETMDDMEDRSKAAWTEKVEGLDPGLFECEVAFYARVAELEDSSLTRVVPAFIGVKDAACEGEPRVMIMEDLRDLVTEDETYQQQASMDDEMGAAHLEMDARAHPTCSLKIGIGRQGWDASPEKRLGIRSYALNSLDAMVPIGNDDAQTLTTVLNSFVTTSSGGFDEELAEVIIEEIRVVEEALGSSVVFNTSNWVGTSLLILHRDGLPAVARIVDFQRVTPSLAGDASQPGKNGALEALKTIVDILSELILRHRFNGFNTTPVAAAEHGTSEMD